MAIVKKSDIPGLLVRSNPALSALSTVPHLRDHFFAPFEEHFNKFFDDYFALQRKPTQHGFPRVDVYEHADDFVVEFSMAGVDPNDVSIQIEDQHPHRSEFVEHGKLLKVSGKMSSEYEHRKDAQYHVKELTRKHFTRSMILPDYVKDDPKASYKNGMLTLTFKTVKNVEEAKPLVRSIPIAIQGDK
jgi:HSP20 family protein